MANRQLEYTADEILMDHRFAEPLLAGGVRCHGGFDDDGNYVSPRTRFRREAITAWQDQHVEDFGTDLLAAPLDEWPGHYPNVEQTRLLLGHGVRQPLIAALTRIGTVEGFGANIRYLAQADMQKFFDDDIRGTAIDHLGRGLIEAHARDEAGYEEEAGHKEMWFAARDIAFEDPVTEDETQQMLERMGFGGGGGSGGGSAMERFMARRRFEDLEPGLEMLIGTMLRVLFIEIKAFHTFAWAEALLHDDDLVAGDGAAGDIVTYIRSDESPHVEYLRTALSEMRDRTFVGLSGRRIPGTEVIVPMWDAAMAESLGVMEDQNRAWTLREIELAVDGHKKAKDIIAEYHHLADVVPGDDGSFTPRPADGGASNGYGY